MFNKKLHTVRPGVRAPELYMIFSLSWGIAAAAEEIDPSAGGAIHPETLPAQASYLALAGAESQEEFCLEKGVFWQKI